jgi:uncharacterized DUF497 family protein
MGFIFAWNKHKAGKNLNKHGVSFEEAATIFEDTLSSTIDDPLHSDHEDRYITIGISIRKRILVVVHTERGNQIRIISARLATQFERKSYEEGREILRS